MIRESINVWFYGAVLLVASAPLVVSLLDRAGWLSDQAWSVLCVVLPVPSLIALLAVLSPIFRKCREWYWGMTEKWKIVWTGIGGAMLLPLGVWAVVNGATRHDERNSYIMGLVLFLVGAGIVWREIAAWKEMKEREAAKQDDLSHQRNSAYLLAWWKRPPGELEGGELPATACEWLLVGLLIIGLAIYPLTRPSEYDGHSGIWIGIGGLVFGIVWLMAGVQQMLVEYKRAVRKRGEEANRLQTFVPPAADPEN